MRDCCKQNFTRKLILFFNLKFYFIFSLVEKIGKQIEKTTNSRSINYLFVFSEYYE